MDSDSFHPGKILYLRNDLANDINIFSGPVQDFKDADSQTLLLSTCQQDLLGTPAYSDIVQVDHEGPFIFPGTFSDTHLHQNMIRFPPPDVDFRGLVIR